jgi:uncharacterized protein YbjT (DUF2867 family)
VRKLSAKGVPLRALVRNAAKAAEIAALPNVEIAIADMAKPETLPAALAGVDRSILNSSADPAMVEVQSNFIAAAAKAGVRHVVKLSGIMPELDSPFRFARMHGEIEKRLEASGMAFTHLRAGEFMPSYFRQVPMILAKGALFLPMENQRIASIDIGDLAEIAAIVLTNPGHEGKIYPLTGPEALTMTEVAERLSAATGKTIKYINVPPRTSRRRSSPPVCRLTSPMRWPSFSPSGARARSHRFGQSPKRCSDGGRRASRSSPRATRRSSVASSRRRDSDRRMKSRGWRRSGP